MRGTMMIFRPGAAAPEHQTLTAPPDLKMLHKVIGGWLEQVPLWYKLDGRPCAALCDEDGKRKQLPVNEAATKLWRREQAMPVDDVLVGTVVVFTGDTAFMQAL